MKNLKLNISIIVSCSMKCFLSNEAMPNQVTKFPAVLKNYSTNSICLNNKYAKMSFNCPKTPQNVNSWEACYLDICHALCLIIN